MTDQEQSAITTLEQMRGDASIDARQNVLADRRNAAEKEADALTTIINGFRLRDELLEAARNINGDDWGVKRELTKPDEWYCWHNDWEGGTEGGFDSALSAFVKIRERI